MNDRTIAERRAAIGAACLRDESQCIAALRHELRAVHGGVARAARDHAIELIHRMRAGGETRTGLAALLHEYDLSSREGILLMCLAEALLRIPDDDTANRFIHDTLVRGDWERHLGGNRSLFVNASTWSLLLTGRWLRLDEETLGQESHALKHFLVGGGEAAIRLIMKRAVGIIARHFILAPTIEQALVTRPPGALYSYDMLGEAALTRPDAERYFRSYRSAIETIGRARATGDDLARSCDVSVKLSALHPRFEESQRRRVLAELAPRLLELAATAAAAHVALTIDAEEADGLELSLDVFETVYRNPRLGAWAGFGFGFAVQAYQKRAPALIDWLAALAASVGRRIPVRLVKGAYWDSEIKRAQERGLTEYPVYTVKAATDLSYLHCAARILARDDVFYPQFATHNSYSVAWILQHAGARRDFEFQRLHGMGDPLYEVLDPGVPCRIYAPVGRYAELLPYLVRRLLENGANSSFVNQLGDERVAAETLAEDPLRVLAARTAGGAHEALPRPIALYGDARRNSSGMYLHDPQVIDGLVTALARANHGAWRAAAPRAAPAPMPRPARALRSPADQACVVGTVEEADERTVDAALEAAAEAFESWSMTDPQARAAVLDQAADLFERDRTELMALCVFEGGRTIADALAEVRETVDACRYYAHELRTNLRPVHLRGVTGESNRLSYHGRGVFACISPWNFPLAIFVGQISAALAAGNCVAAKPASQTPLVAARAVELLHQAGVPPPALCLLPGAGRELGAKLVADPRVSGVAFTGSTETAAEINRLLAARPGAIIPFIAETGGQNVMIADSSALVEQVVRDTILSAFNSAGQRCSALRVLLVQQEIAPAVIESLRGAMLELEVGHPGDMATDVGPLIDGAALTRLREHRAYLEREAIRVQEVPLRPDLPPGNYFGPAAYEIHALEQLRGEVFGPILHVLRYARAGLGTLLRQVNGMGYGLTLGVHSRIEETLHYVIAHARAGNIYVNRNMIGAVIGVQPFGGEGLSGTGPKSGGPDYLKRFSVERTVTVNTTAVGGNAELLSARTAGQTAGGTCID